MKLNWRKKKVSQCTQPKYTDSHELYTENEQYYYRIIRFNDKEQPKSKSNCIVTSKYGILSFLPLFFIEQLKHFSNQYFIFISILQQIPDASPLGRFTTIIPLSFIFCLSAIKSIIQDIIKHTKDRKANHTYVEVFRNGVLINERWNQIGVGDILKVKKNETFPADLVLLSSSELHGTCHIETTILDGEINLKVKQCPQETSNCKKLQDFIDLNGIIECELPNKLLNRFLGRLTVINNNYYPIPLDDEQFLPKGSILRNSKWIYGTVIYTGQETKLMLNQNLDSSKVSAMDKMLNSHIKMVFLLISLLSLFCATCSTWWTKKQRSIHWYLELKDTNAYTFCLQVISFFILFHNMIPISLQVYIEVIRFLQAWFIENDIDMFHEESNLTAMVRSSNLNVELSKVKYIFTDISGTLTKNSMKLKHFSIAGELYLEESQNKIANNLIHHSTKNDILEFFRIMTVCHTVISKKIKNSDDVVYNASSADELALVIGSRKFGFTFHTRGPKSIKITMMDAEEHYEILNIIEFTNSRKMMSVIVRTPDSKIKLYCKGADTAVFKCLSKSGEMYKNKSMVHLNNFARAGYRTLCFAYANISESFYKVWKDEYLKASTVLINRDSAKNKVAEKIERKLKLIGVTAIENKLQSDVPKTIESLMKANMKLWIITGDKQETAINIGLSTRLITESSQIIIFNESKLMDFKHAIHKNTNYYKLAIQNKDCILIINGRLLEQALSKNIKMNFLKLCINLKSVICCRMSSSQKAEIVDLVTRYTNEVTLAIGDKANDVPTFNRASIGVGVLGLEGLRSYSASDYSIPQFKYLPKLLLVHGAWNYEKISKMIYFCYYKNICFYALLLWFAVYTGWSAQVLFDRWNICMFNVVYTAAPPLIIGLFLTTHSKETRLECPKLYFQNQNVFNYKQFWIWITIGVLHSIIIFLICLFIMKHEVIWSKGRVGDYSVLGNIIYTSTLVIVCLKAGFYTQSWSIIVHLTTWASILSWISFIIIYNQLRKFFLIFSVSIKLDEIIFSSPIFWTTVLLTTTVVLILDLVVITTRRILWNHDTHDVLRKEKDIKNANLIC